MSVLFSRKRLEDRRLGSEFGRCRSIEALEPRAMLAANVVISEFMASNTETLADSQGEFHDWIELHNRGNEEVDLEGWALRDRGAQFQFPKVVLGADEHIVLFASGSQKVVEEPFEIHTNFKLARTGEYLGLRDPQGNVVSEFNPYPPLEDDVSYGLSHDDVFPQFFQNPTPGTRNPSAPNVYISEFMAINQNTLTDEDGDFADWIELYNAGDSSANLAGWKLFDSSADWEFEAVTLPANEYLVVFATGNDRRDPAGELHTNFKLGGNGDRLMLMRPDGNLASSFRNYPQQSTDVSYGLPSANSEPQFFQTPTPGARNAVADRQVRFSSPSGLYNGPILLTLSSEDPEAEIRYTLDGSLPTSESPQYQEPFQIVDSSVVRAAVMEDGNPVTVVTRSYLITPSILRQNGNGRPQTWGAVADYEMDPQVVGNGLSTNEFFYTPAISISVDPDDLFSITDGIFAHPLMEGPEWQRPASVEVIGSNFSRPTGPISATLRTTGENDERNPAVTSKFSMELIFDQLLDQEGVGRPLFNTERSLDRIVLRAGHADSWVADSSENRDQATYRRDSFILQTQRDMGQPALASQSVNVFLNGLYWGTYTATESPTQHTFAEQVGGLASNFDLVGQQGIIEGESAAWDNLLTLANEDLSRPEAFAAVAALVDLENLMDFILLKRYAGIGDAAEQSWVAGRDRTGTNGFQFLMFSNERSFGIEPTPAPNGALSNAPQFLFDRLAQNERFVSDFADRVNHHFLSGVFRDSYANARWNNTHFRFFGNLESARWGDYRRDANPQGGGAVLYGASNLTVAVQSVRDFVSNRRATLTNELQDEGLFTEVPPPELDPHRVVHSGFLFTITTPSGEIFYTIDGTDPRGEDGEPSESAIRYSTAIAIEQTQQIKARALDGEKWSPLSSAVVQIRFGSPLRVTEVMYHPGPPAEDSPYDDDDFEFVEIQNVSDQPALLTGHRFNRGIFFEFDDGDVRSLDSGELMLVVKNKAAFASRYDTEGLLIAGEYDGQLNNGGDSIHLVGPFDEHVLGHYYSDLEYRLSDGNGFSLEYSYDENNVQTTNVSSIVHGTPGFLADVLPVGSLVVSEVLASGTDANGDWIELQNRTTETMDISGWYLSDSQETLRKFRIPANTTIGPGQFLVFNELSHFGNVANPNALVQFSLSAGGETVFLTSVDDEGRLGGYREQAEFGATQLNVSMGRIDKADGTFEYAALTRPTKGFANSPVSVGPVVISEIMHSPVTSRLGPGVIKQPEKLNVGEFVEIQNITNRPIPLYDTRNPNATWRFSEGISFVFPEGQILPANGRALVVRMDPEIFRERAGLAEGVLIYGPFEGVLRNEGEAIALTQASSANDEADTVYTVIDRVEYDDTAPWPGIAKSGSSIERRLGNAYANDSGNWMPSRFGGSPGMPNVGVDERPRRVPFTERFNVDSVDELVGWQFTSASNSQWLVPPRGSQVSVYRDDSCQFCESAERLSTMSVAFDIQTDRSLAALLEFRSTDYGTLLELSDDGKNWTTILSGISLYGEVGINLSDQLARHGMGGQGVRYLRLSGAQVGLSNFSITPGDVVGPSVVEHQFHVEDSLESINFTFNEPVGDITAQDIRISDPLGRNIEPIAIESNDNVNWTVTLPKQDLAGRYHFLALGSIQDAAGNPLNNFEYSLNGKAPSDGIYRADVVIDPAETASFPYSEGFENGPLENLAPWAFEVTPGSTWELHDDPSRDGTQLRVANYGAFRIATDLTDRVGNDVTLDFWARSDARWRSYVSVQIVGEGFPPLFLASAILSTRQYGHFALDVDETLRNIGLDLSRPFDIVVWANRGEVIFDDIRISDTDAFGPRVIDSTTGLFDGPVSSVSLTFDEPVDIVTLRDGLAVNDPMGMPIPISNVRQGADDRSYVADFTSQRLAGEYRILVRETVTDLVGNPMDQTRNFFAGEFGDTFEGRFSIASQPIKSFPYRQSFERGVDGLDGWSFAVQNSGAWELGPNAGDGGGEFGLRTAEGGGGRLVADLSLDLSERLDDDQLSLTFLAKSKFGRPYGQLYVSGGEGQPFRHVSPIRFEPEYVAHSIDLKSHLNAALIALDDDVRVRFEVRNAGNMVYLDEVIVSDEQVVGPQIVEQSGLELTDHEASVTVQFDQPVDVSTFTTDDASLRLIESSIDAQRVTAVDDRTFTIVFPRPQSAGQYTLEVGPRILNSAGIPMNQTADAFNGLADDVYTGTVFVPLDPQPIPYSQDFASAEVTDLSGWLFQTINQQGNFAGGRWDVTETMEPFGDYHLQATQFADCWSEHDGILAVDYTEFVGNTDMVLEFNMRRTATSFSKSRFGERNLGQIRIGENLNAFVQAGHPTALLYDDGVARFGDLNGDGVADLVPNFDDYVFYRFDLDKMIQDAGIEIGETLYINFHRTAFFSTDVTLFDNIRVYDAGQQVRPPRIIGVRPHLRYPGIADSASIAFDQPVTGFDLSDLRLSRNGGPNLLTDDNSLFETEPGTFVITDIHQVADLPGDYRLSLVAEQSEIRNESGESITEGYSRSWTDTRRPGDSNLDGYFNSSDFVLVFVAAQYEDDIVGNSTWWSGDWNGDSEFTSSDFVAAFVGGYYNKPADPFFLAARPAVQPDADQSPTEAVENDDLRIRDAAFAAAIAFDNDLEAIDALFNRKDKNRAFVV